MNVKHFLRADKSLWLEGAPYRFIPVEGIRPTLVAHADTVWREPPELECHHHIIRSAAPHLGIGADDRAGLYLASVLASRLKCHLLITDEEEVGGHGARAAIENIEIGERSSCFIQLDRRGSDNVITYDYNSDDLEAEALAVGFVSHQGTFTDISILGPAFARQAINVSCGYYEEHTPNEWLNLLALQTIERMVTRLIKNIADEVFVAVPKPPPVITYSKGNDFSHYRWNWMRAWDLVPGDRFWHKDRIVDVVDITYQDDSQQVVITPNRGDPLVMGYRREVQLYDDDEAF